jgi:glycine cleavage system H protein
MTNIPADLKYTKDDEWIRVNGNHATIGITDFAQGELTDIVYVELPQEGEEIEKGKPFMVVESVKASSDIHAALSGKVTRTNKELESSPELVNKDPYGEGWLVKIELTEPGQLNGLISADDYQAHLNTKK